MTINTKEGAILFDDAGENEEKYVGYKDMIVLADLLKQRFEEETEKEAVIYADGDRCEIYISNENIGMVFDILKERLKSFFFCCVKNL